MFLIIDCWVGRVLFLIIENFGFFYTLIMKDMSFIGRSFFGMSFFGRPCSRLLTH